LPLNKRQAFQFKPDDDETFADKRRLRNGTLCPISASGSNFNPRNIPYIPVVEIFAFLELEHKLPFFKGLLTIICLTTKNLPLIFSDLDCNKP